MFARERTSIHLTEQLRGNRDFVRCPIADIITNPDLARTGDDPSNVQPIWTWCVGFDT